MTDGDYEVVIGGDDGLEKQHADLMRKELIADGCHEDAVAVREVEE